MSYHLFKSNLALANITNTEMAYCLGMANRQAITLYNVKGRKVPVCMMLLSETIADLAKKGVGKEIILAQGQPINYDDLKKVIIKAGLNNKLFAEYVGYDPRIISQYKRQGVPRCMGMLARLLFLTNIIA
jgi:hypothetical protein